MRGLLSASLELSRWWSLLPALPTTGCARRLSGHAWLLGEFLSFFKAVLISAVRHICVIKTQILAWRLTGSDDGRCRCGADAYSSSSWRSIDRMRSTRAYRACPPRNIGFFQDPIGVNCDAPPRLPAVTE